VTAYIAAVALFLLKLFCFALAALVVAVVLLALVPVKARVSGSVSASRLLEAVFEDDATVIIRTGGQPPLDLESGEPVVPLDLDYSLDAAVMGGAVGVSMAGGRGVEVAVFGVRFEPKRRKQEPRPAGELRKPSGDGKREDARRDDRPKAKPKKRGLKIGEIRKYLAPEVREKTWEALRSVTRSLHLHGELNVECGFPDPGVTGMVAASYWALGGDSAVRGVTFRPRFEGEMLDVRGSGGLWLIPAQLGWVLCRYLLAREIRPLWRKRRGGRAVGTDTGRFERAQAAD